MKKPLYHLTMICTAICLLAACRKMDDNYKEFLTPGGIIYPGKALSPRVHPGNSRAMISWLRGPDPQVVKARIYWNNYTDSVEFNIGEKEDTVRYTFTSLAENDYTFNIRTYDEDGNVSIPVEVAGTVFGSRYQSGLLTRALNASTLGTDGSLLIEWGAADTTGGAIATEVRYTNTNGELTTRQFDARSDSSWIMDYQPNTAYAYRTLFLPDSLAIDTFYTDYTEQTPASKIDRTAWTATASTFEATGQLPNGGPAEFVLDGRTDTYWHSRHTSAITGYPYWLAFDMQSSVQVTRVELISRPDYYREDFTEFSIQGSDDGVEWRTYGTFTLPDQTGPRSFNIIGAPVMRHIRVYMTKGVTIHSHLAEFAVYGVMQ